MEMIDRRPASAAPASRYACAVVQELESRRLFSGVASMLLRAPSAALTQHVVSAPVKHDGGEHDNEHQTPHDGESDSSEHVTPLVNGQPNRGESEDDHEVVRPSDNPTPGGQSGNGQSAGGQTSGGKSTGKPTSGNLTPSEKESSDDDVSATPSSSGQSSNGQSGSGSSSGQVTESKPEELIDVSASEATAAADGAHLATPSPTRLAPELFAQDVISLAAGVSRAATDEAIRGASASIVENLATSRLGTGLEFAILRLAGNSAGESRLPGLQPFAVALNCGTSSIRSIARSLDEMMFGVGGVSRPLDYHFAPVTASAPLFDAISRFVNQCATLTPTAIVSPDGAVHHTRAWTVTTAVILADVALGSYVLLRARQRKAIAQRAVSASVFSNERVTEADF